MSLKDIKGKIQSVKRTRKVTKAMEAVSAVKMRKSQNRALGGRSYAAVALSILERLSPSLSKVNNSLTEKREVKRAAVAVVTSDKGLCGALNAAVLKEAQKTIDNLNLPKEAIDIYAYGKRGAEYFEKRGYSLKERIENLSDDVLLSDFEKISNEIVGGFLSEKYDKALLVYTNFKSTFEQEPKSSKMLPLSIEHLRDIVTSIVPEKGLYSNEGVKEAPAYYTVEPNPEEVLSELIPKLVSILIYHSLLESKASEHSARMVAMKNASDKSEEVTKTLTIKFNKARQAIITREVSEIVGGIEAMAAS